MSTTRACGFGVTVIGDSTIDNRVWVSPGIKGNYLRTRLGIKPESAASRVKKSHRKFFKPELAVVEHLKDMLPNHDIHDHTNDGFTTSDVLRGAYRDKVFGQGTLNMFPHTLFQPLVEGKHDIQFSDVIILSVGGNNVREFLQAAFAQPNPYLRQQFIRKQFSPLMEKLRKEYLDILRDIRKTNSDALIVTMTQHYPSVIQDDYRIYSFMEEVGHALNIEGDATDVIHHLVTQTYTGVLENLDDKNICVADITSTLNPFDTKNHVKQIEPSGQGGKKIAELLKHILDARWAAAGKVFRSNVDGSITTSPVAEWKPKHPHEFTDMECHRLLNRLAALRDTHRASTPMYVACDAVYNEASEVLANLHKVDCSGNDDLTVLYADEGSDRVKREHILVLRQSLSKTLSLLEMKDASKEQLATAVTELRTHAKKVAIGHSNFFGKLAGALIMLAGAMMFAFGLITLATTAGASTPLSAGVLVAGAATFAAGVGVFAASRQSSLSKQVSKLADAVEKAEPKAPSV